MKHTLYLFLAIIALLPSCQKEFVMPEEIVEELPPVYVPDSMRINFIWVAPNDNAPNLIGARLELRNMEDSLLLNGVDIMGSQDSVFQWYPSIGLNSDSYYFKLKSPTGQPLDSCAIQLSDALGKDEWIIQQPNYTYYIQLTWIMDDSLSVEGQ
jgi:hypothetical protein